MKYRVTHNFWHNETEYKTGDVIELDNATDVEIAQLKVKCIVEIEGAPAEPAFLSEDSVALPEPESEEEGAKPRSKKGKHK